MSEENLPPSREGRFRLFRRSESQGREVAPSTSLEISSPPERVPEKAHHSLQQTPPDQQLARVREELRSVQQKPAVDQQHGALRTLATVLTIGAEMIPGGLGPYGIGDGLTALEALVGRTLDGLHLTPWERVLYLAASVIPVIPARPFIAGYRYVKGLRKKT
jgi:hypothetical protein